MIGLLILLLHLITVPPAGAQQGEGLPSAGRIELPEVILFGRDTFFLPLPAPPQPAAGRLPWPAARVRPLEVEERALYPGAMVNSTDAAQPAGSTTETAVSGGSPAGSPEVSTLTTPAFPRSGPGARNADWGLTWEAAWWPAARWEAGLEAQWVGGGWGSSLSLSGGLPDILPDSLLGPVTGPDRPGWLLLGLQAAPLGSALSLRVQGGTAFLDPAGSRFLGGSELTARGAGRRVHLDSATRWLGLYPEAWQILEHDLLLESGAERFQPELRLKGILWKEDGWLFSGLAGLGGRWEVERFGARLDAGAELLVRQTAPGVSELHLSPRAGLELPLGPRLAWNTTAGAYLESLAGWETLLLETRPALSSPAPVHGWSLRSGLLLEPQGEAGRADGLGFQAEYTRGRLYAATGDLLEPVPAHRIDLSLSVSRRLLSWLRADLYYRVGSPLAAAGGWDLQQSLAAGLAMDFDNAPLGVIIDLQWAENPLTGSVPPRFETVRGMPGGRAGLHLLWKLNPYARLGVACELLTGPDLSPRDFRLGLSWQAQRIEE